MSKSQAPIQRPPSYGSKTGTQVEASLEAIRSHIKRSAQEDVIISGARRLFIEQADGSLVQVTYQNLGVQGEKGDKGDPGPPGPAGPPGSGGTVNNATVNAAISTNPSASRAALALGTAALSAIGDFDAAGAATGAVTTHLAALDPHPQYLTVAEADSAYAFISHSHSNVVAGGAAGYMTGTDKTKLDGIASGATANDTDANLKNRANHTGTQLAATISDFSSAVGAIAQPLDADLTAIAALVTTTFGRSLLTQADAAATRTTLGLAAVASSGSAADLSVGTLLAARMPALTGDITTVAGSVATTLATVNSNVGTFGSASAVPIITVNGKGLITAVTTAALGTIATQNANAVAITGGTGAFTGALTTTASGIGYATGAGGTVTQLTSKATGVTLSKITGTITLNAAALAAATIVSFTLTNTTIAATDILVVQHVSGGTSGAYTVNAFPAAGSAVIAVRNNTAGSLSEAIVIRFAVLKSVNA